MSRMLSKMNLISTVQQLPKEDIETIQGYVEMIEEENQKYKEVIDKAIEYIEKCLKQTPTENRTKTDDTLDIEYEYILGILKEVE